LPAMAGFGVVPKPGFKLPTPGDPTVPGRGTVPVTAEPPVPGVTTIPGTGVMPPGTGFATPPLAPVPTAAANAAPGIASVAAIRTIFGIFRMGHLSPTAPTRIETPEAMNRSET
jgi:hypothetical protein